MLLSILGYIIYGIRSVQVAIRSPDDPPPVPRFMIPFDTTEPSKETAPYQSSFPKVPKIRSPFRQVGNNGKPLYRKCEKCPMCLSRIPVLRSVSIQCIVVTGVEEEEGKVKIGVSLSIVKLLKAPPFPMQQNGIEVQKHVRSLYMLPGKKKKERKLSSKSSQFYWRVLCSQL